MNRPDFKRRAVIAVVVAMMAATAAAIVGSWVAFGWWVAFNLLAPRLGEVAGGVTWFAWLFGTVTLVIGMFWVLATPEAPEP